MKKFLLPLTLLLATVSLQAQIRVKIGGTGDGSSWAKAASLDSALNIAKQTPNSEIWVTQGVYYPTKTVVIPSNTKVYGGFDGTETSIDQRHYAEHTTVLDAQKQFRVVSLSSGALLCGFTVRNGLANTPQQENGGGIYMEADATVQNCHIINNIALYNGGGIFAEGNGLVFNALIKGNKISGNGDGAAIYGTALAVRNNTIVENEQLPAPTTSQQLPNFAICAGEKITMTVPTNNGQTYLWNTGETSRSITTPALSTTTTYTVTVTSADKNNVYILSSVVTVRPNPTLVVATNKSTANVGDTCTFTAKGMPVGGRYVWQNGSTDTVYRGVMDSVKDLQATCTYILDGCSSPAKLTIIDNTKCTPPTAPIGVVVSSNVICKGESVEIALVGGQRNSGAFILYEGGCNGVAIDSGRSIYPQLTITPDSTTTYCSRGEGCGVVLDGVTVTVTVNPPPPAITGDSAICPGASTKLTCADKLGTGTWLSENPDIVSVGNDGTVTGVASGRGKIIYTNLHGCSSQFWVTVKDLPSMISGNTNICQGSSVTFTSMPMGGTWAWVGTTDLATLDNSGLVTATTDHKIGSATLKYTHPTNGCSREITIQVRQQPQISENDRDFCESGAAVQIGATPSVGGTWSITPHSVATISATGMLTPISAGNAVISYATNYCTDTLYIKVNPTPTSLSVSPLICEGTVINAAIDPDFGGGNWNASNAHATITKIDASTAAITGVSAGTFDLTYTAPTGCSITVSGVTVEARPTEIQGKSVVGVGQSITLASTPTTGLWSSNNENTAIVGLTTGMVTGISQGFAIISYRLPSTCRDTHLLRVAECPAFTLTTQPTTANQSVCNGQPIDPVTLSLTGATTSTIKWRLNSVNKPQPAGLTWNPTTHTLSGAPTTAGVYQYTIQSTNHDAACPEASLTFVLTVFDTVRGGEVSGNETLCAGQVPARFPTVSDGSGGSGNGTYQWQKSTDNVNFTDIENATNRSFNETEQLSQTTYYRRKYTRMLCEEAYSNTITVTVNPLPAVPSFDKMDNGNCTGGSGSITFTAPTGAEFLYALSGTAEKPFQSGVLFDNLSDGTYTAKVKDSTTGCENSTAVTIDNTSENESPILELLMVTDKTGAILGSNLLGAARCSDFNDTVRIVPFMQKWGNTTFAWTSTNGLTSTDSVLIIPPSKLDATATYTLKVVNDNTCDDQDEITLTIVNAANYVIGEQPKSDTACIRQKQMVVRALLDDETQKVYFQWQSSSNNVDFEDISNAQAANYNIDNMSPSNLYYRCVITPADGICGILTSDVAHVLILPLPDIANVEDGNRCGAGSVQLVASAESATDSILWYTSLAAGSPIGKTLSGEPFNTPSISATTTYYAEAINERCMATERKPVTATIKAEHEIYLNQGKSDTSLCVGTPLYTIGYIIGGSAQGVNVTWEPVKPNVTVSEVIASRFSISGSPTTPGSYTYTITTTGNSCPQKTVSGTITVNETPAMPSVDFVPACDSTMVRIVSPKPATTHYWQTIADGTSQSLAADTIMAYGTGTYHVRAYANTCWSATRSVAVTVYQSPAITTQPDTETQIWGMDDAAAYNAIPALTVTATGREPLTYQWYRTTKNANTGGTLVKDATSATYKPVDNFINDSSFYYCIVTNSCGSTASNVSGVFLKIGGCNVNTPGWGESLGTVGFATSSQWILGNKVWSDVVTASNCAKSTYKAIDRIGNQTVYYADCREPYTAQAGTFFSYCAVNANASTLCPAPWRVPTQAEYAELDLFLGGTGQNRTDAATIGLYEKLWNLNYGGYINCIPAFPASCGEEMPQQIGGYWSQTEVNATSTYAVQLVNTGSITLSASVPKSIGLRVRCIKDIPTTTSCNNETPAFGASLGEVSFATSGTWVVGNQIWSDAVSAENCQKNTFNGGSPLSASFNADCRNNPTATGDLFSYCAVNRFASVLCPAPWRVPTMNDYITLDKAFNGSGENGQSSTALRNNYLGQWGAVFTGYALATPPDTIYDLAVSGHYWSQPVANVPNAFRLFIRNTGNISPALPTSYFMGLSLRCVQDMPANKCNINTPGWGSAGLGTVSFTSDKLTYIKSADNAIAQIWSEPVTATNCQKDTFNGGTITPFENFNADCRSNPNQKGDLFSWCAIARFGNQLCPSPWRVPTKDEYVNLDLALGGNGQNRTASPSSSIYKKYLATSGTDGQFWGATYSGGSNASGTLEKPNFAYYWTQTEYNTTDAHNLGLNRVQGNIWPQENYDKSLGYALRCIKDGPATCNTNTPGFGNSLGSITTTSDMTWTMGDLVWSDALKASNCNKTTFNGGTVNNYNADCRTNPVARGDLFSWCAIMRYDTILCPYPWRIPSRQDWISLNQTLGGTAGPDTNLQLFNTYMQYLGAAFAYTGYVDQGNNMVDANIAAYEWSQTNNNPNAYNFWVHSGGVVDPQHSVQRGSGLHVRCVRDVDQTVEPCNNNTPAYGDDLGTITFASDSTYAVDGLVWSDAVTASNCQKTTFSFGMAPYNADCRANPEQRGDLFSGCVIKRFADQICPAGWRIPTVDEFVKLDKFMGGTGENGQTGAPMGECEEEDDYGDLPFTAPGAKSAASSTMEDISTRALSTYLYDYICDWGGRYEGYATNAGTFNAGISSNYWSQSFASPTSIYCLHYNSSGTVNPKINRSMNFAFAVRCVHDEQPDGCDLGTPAFGTTLGQVTFASDTTWTVGGVEWSDVVVAENCRKESYYGGNFGSYTADCRTGLNATDKGDLFSWCAVKRYENEICPDGWRVPTKDDYVLLYSALGGTDYEPNVWIDNPLIAERYLSLWGGTFQCNTGDLWMSEQYDGPVSAPRQKRLQKSDEPYYYDCFAAMYWSSTSVEKDLASVSSHDLYQYGSQTFGYVAPQGFMEKYTGTMVRCVRGSSHASCNGDSIGMIGGLIGEISFANNDGTRYKHGNQTWSAPVKAKGCNKTTYSGGQVGGSAFNIDCRSIGENEGDFFSFCAVQRYGAVLCPAPWRVPSKDEFVELDKYLGGDGLNGQQNANLLQKYTKPYAAGWQGVLSDNSLNGIVSSAGEHARTNNGVYWSRTATSSGGYALLLTTDGGGTVNPQYESALHRGYQLRCILDETGCKSNEPNFGESLGTVTFATDSTWIVGNQIWSDAVTAINCQKTTYDGGVIFDRSNVNLIADCRSNPNGKGDFFSWCAVSRFNTQLCPAPWRLPLEADFNKLYSALGGAQKMSAQNFLSNVLGYWGARFPVGAVTMLSSSGWEITGETNLTYYWSNAETAAWSATCLNLSLDPNGTNMDKYGLSVTSLSKNMGQTVRCVRDMPTVATCADNTPGWGASLGTVSFETPTTTFITDYNTIAQVWSDEVTATNCQKGGFAGGSSPNFNADCRSSSYDGDYFSWCAVAKFGNQLCPAPWRVPTKDDYVNLDLALGGNGANRFGVGSSNAVLLKYIATSGTVAQFWGGTYGGYCGVSGAFGDQSQGAHYWSQTVYNATLANNLHLYLPGNIVPQDANYKSNGFRLRCIKDTAVPATDANGCKTGTPEFGPSLGTVSFETNQTWFIRNDDSARAQIWSDAVTAVNCQKAAFGGGSTANYLADCRNNPDSDGDLFSWCAVSRFAEALCPAPWRVPTGQDFDKLLSFIGVAPLTEAQYNANILGYWGAQKAAGVALDDYLAENDPTEDYTSAYWSTTEDADPTKGQSYYHGKDKARSYWESLKVPLTKNLGVTLRCVRDTTVVPLPLPAGCGGGTPEWGAGGLGAVSFDSTRTWYVTDYITASQVWSSPVTAANCAKANYSGGNAAGAYKSDCRQTGDGTLFSWCAVARYGAQLCPAPWRVPTQRDYIRLDSVLGGKGTNGQTDAQLLSNYKQFWGYANRGGYFNQDGQPYLNKEQSYYWTQTNSTNTQAYYSSLSTSANPQQNAYHKGYGMSLRCVRDTTLQVLPVPLGCSTVIPGWGAQSLGEVGYVSNKTWFVTDYDSIAQVWTDNVTASACQKGTYNGGIGIGDFRTDCRQAQAGYPGDYFSFCAVGRFGNAVLCPYPWRVPEKRDFERLDLALGGNGGAGNYATAWVHSVAGVQRRYMDSTVWGARYQAYCYGNGTDRPTGDNSVYWSNTIFDASRSYCSRYQGDQTVYAGTYFEVPRYYGLPVRCVKDTVVKKIPVPTGCSNAEPNYGLTLGTVSFATPTTKFISNGTTIAQVWSDAVTATNCQKTTYNGGLTVAPFLADCRKRTDAAAYPGDYFSWCAVNRFKAELCPEPWRVPTKQDFIDLDIAMGGSGAWRQNANSELPKYVGTSPTQWAGQYGGSLVYPNIEQLYGEAARYWSITDDAINGTDAHALMFSTANSGEIYPNGRNYSKQNGLAVRCVRDSILPPKPSIEGYSTSMDDWENRIDDQTFCTPRSEMTDRITITPTIVNMENETAATYQWECTSGTCPTPSNGYTSKNLELNIDENTIAGDFTYTLTLTYSSGTTSMGVNLTARQGHLLKITNSDELGYDSYCASVLNGFTPVQFEFGGAAEGVSYDSENYSSGVGTIEINGNTGRFYDFIAPSDYSGYLMWGLKTEGYNGCPSASVYGGVEILSSPTEEVTLRIAEDQMDNCQHLRFYTEDGYGNHVYHTLKYASENYYTDYNNVDEYNYSSEGYLWFHEDPNEGDKSFWFAYENNGCVGPRTLINISQMMRGTRFPPKILGWQIGKYPAQPVFTHHIGDPMNPDLVEIQAGLYRYLEFLFYDPDKEISGEFDEIYPNSSSGFDDINIYFPAEYLDNPEDPNADERFHLVEWWYRTESMLQECEGMGLYDDACKGQPIGPQASFEELEYGYPDYFWEFPEAWTSNREILKTHYSNQVYRYGDDYDNKGWNEFNESNWDQINPLTPYVKFSVNDFYKYYIPYCTDTPQERVQFKFRLRNDCGLYIETEWLGWYVISEAAQP